MTILCIEYKVVSVNYFMDDMQMYEVFPLMTHLHLTFRQGWEQTRQLMFSTLSPYLKKGKKLTDIIKFPWDKEDKKTQHITPKIEMTPEKLQEMVRRGEERRRRNNRE